MEKGAKIAIVIVVALLLIGGIVALIFTLRPAERENTSLTQRLDTPTNIRVDMENRILSFDPVTNAEQYQIYINGGQNAFNSSQTQVDISRYINDYGLYSFQVRALHSTPDYNSYLSDSVFVEYSTTLLAPASLSLDSNDVLYWTSVANAVSYNIIIASDFDANGDPIPLTSEPLRSDSNNFDFSTILNQYPYSELDFIAFYVQATSVNLITGEENAYIHESELSEPTNYFRTTSIRAPEIRLNPSATNFSQGTVKSLVWEIDGAVASYEVYIDGMLATTIPTTGIATGTQYSLELDSLLINGIPVSDTLGSHSVYIRAVPRSNPNFVIASQDSEIITYSVTHTLSTPDASTVRITKEGNNLVIRWDPISDTNPYDPNTPYVASSYTLVLLANANGPDEEPDFFDFKTVQQLVAPMYTISLDELADVGSSFCVQIQAVREGNQYILNSQFSAMSEAYDAVTQLMTPTNVRVVDLNGVYSLSWREVEGAQAGYLVRVQEASMSGTTIVLGNVVLTQTVMSTSIQISDYMSANGLGPGMYAISIITRGYSVYFVDSEPSEVIAFDYKVRLATPTIISIERQATDVENKYTFAMSFTYVEGAQYYNVQVDNNDAGVITQPSSRPANGIIVDTQFVSNYINGYDVPGQYRVTVQAIVRDDLENIHYINGVPSTSYTIVNSYQHVAPTNLRYEQNGNAVSLEWDPVKTVTDSNGHYGLEINGNLISSIDTSGTYLEDISRFLRLGSNTISVYSADSGQLYIASERVTIEMNYSYVLSGSSSLVYSALNDTREVQIIIPGFNQYVTNYYLVFGTGETRSVEVSERDEDGNLLGGSDAIINVDSTCLPLFQETYITIYAGKIDADTDQANLTPCSWTTSFTNTFFMDPPEMSIDTDTYTLTLSVAPESIPYTYAIEWRLTGPTGNHSTYIRDFTSNTFTIDLTTLEGFISVGGDLVIGSYNIYAVAIATTNTMRSPEVSTNFSIYKQLDTPTNFVAAIDNSYLQWDYIENVDSYNIEIQGTQYSDAVWGEYTANVDGTYKRVIRLTIPTGVFSVDGVYEFKITAQSNNEFYRSSEGIYRWTFSNKLPSPNVSVVDRNGELYLQIMSDSNSLVSYYTVSIPELPGVSTEILATSSDAFVYYNLQSLLDTNSAPAGEYTLVVISYPVSDIYTASEPALCTFTLSRQFDTPLVTALQDMNTNEIVISWDDVSANVSSGGSISQISPSGYRLTVTNATNNSQTFSFTQTVLNNNYRMTGDDLVNMASGNYIISVTALGNGAMLDSFVGSTLFIYQEQLTAPQISYYGLSNNYHYILDDENAIISISNADSRANTFELRVELLDSTGAVASTKTFDNLTWQGNRFTLSGEDHFSERGIYRVSVRNSQYASYAPSPWSNALILYVSKAYKVAENISLTYDGAQFTLSFDALTSPSDYTLLNNYSATISYVNGDSNGSLEFEAFTGSPVTFAGDAGWVSAISAEGAVFTIEITANTSAVNCSPSDLGLTQFDFAQSSTTNYIFTIGRMNTPSNIEFTVSSLDSSEITVSWVGDLRYRNPSYNYTVSISSASGNTLYLTSSNTWAQTTATLSTYENSITFNLPSDIVWVVTFTISARSVADNVESLSAVARFINARDLPEITGVTITYDDTTGYVATWNDVRTNDPFFTDGTYSLRINGQVVTPLVITAQNGNVSTVIDSGIIESALSVSRSAVWTIDITATYCGDLIAYNAQNYSGYTDLPVVITDAPTNLMVENNMLSWDPVLFATQYEVFVSLTEDGPAIDDNIALVKSTTYDISNLIAGLDAGDYFVSVRVAADEAHDIQTSALTETATISFLVRTQADPVTGLTVTPIANPGGATYITYVSWTYYQNYTFQGVATDEPVRFTVYITDSSGNVAYVVQNMAATLDRGNPNDKFTYTILEGNNASFTFNYLDGTKNGDITRSLAAGECVLSVVVCGNDVYYDSTPASRNFDNKFALTSITDTDPSNPLFTVFPDAFVGEGGIVDNEITSPSDDLTLYEENYGFNEKYLIITNDTLSYAQFYKVYISTGTDSEGEDIYQYVGTIENHAIDPTYEAFTNTTYKLRLPNTVAGVNNIKLVPYGDENYYFYLSGSNEYALYTAIAEQSTSSYFSRTLYQRYEAPAISDNSLDIGYSDSPNNLNVNRVNIVFNNAVLGGQYLVTPHYKDYYNGYAETVADSFIIKLGEDDFDYGVPLGLAVYDKIKMYGPFEFWFEVKRVNTENEFMLNSHTSTTKEFIFTTKLMEFAPALNGNASVNSLVTEITANNEDDFAKNGSLTWTLPTHPYSIRVQYIVRISDLTQEFGSIVQTQRHILPYSVYLNINVDENGKITYTIDQNDSGYFTLDTPNNRLIFDMKGYFNNTIRAGKTGDYYLAGTYEYMITATAFDKNGKGFATRIFSPNSYGTADSMRPYTYRDIAFICGPKDVTLNSDGLLSWTYSDSIYGDKDFSTAKFMIEIYAWNEARTEFDFYEIEFYEPNENNEYSINISDYLIAGGSARNDVYIYTMSPMQYFLDSKRVTVSTTSLPTSTQLPAIEVTWDDHRRIDVSITTDISEKIYQDIVANENTIWLSVSILKLAGWAVGDATPAPGRDYDEIRIEGDALDEIVWDQPVTADHYQYIEYNRGMLDYTFDLIAQLNALANANLIVADRWLSGSDSLASGYYYVKVSLGSSSPYYSINSDQGEKMVREIWRSSTQDATLTGPYVTTKLSSETANPVDGNDRAWGEAQYKNAYLNMNVTMIRQERDNGQIVYNLPSTITVTARLYTNPGYDVNNYYSMTYNIPAPSNLGTADTFLDPDNPNVRITRVYNDGVVDNTRMSVTIDIHDLFDTNMNAGVYHIYWVLNGDEVGDSSPISDPYRLPRELCHYVVLPTPILDYRLDYTGTNYDNYVINWILTPDKYSYLINNTCDYNLNIFAFEQLEDGTYASDILFDSLTPEEQAEFYSYEMNGVYFDNNPNVTTKLEEYANVSVLNGRDCYINLTTDNGMQFTPNKSYKVYMYISSRGWNETMPVSAINQLYYLPSDTSLGVEYVYKKVSGQHQNASVEVTESVGYPLENTDMANNAYYTFTSYQPDYYNNAFELYIYNTQDPRASTNANWTALQEAEGTYLAHWIIGTRDNVAGIDSNGDATTQSLYILYDYEDRRVGSGIWDYDRDTPDRPIGILVDRAISFDKLTLTELLYNDLNQGNILDKILTPITYYCKIKTWINNNEVNANAPTNTVDGVTYYVDDSIYSERWIRENIPFVKNADGSINEEEVQKFYASLGEQQIAVPFLDINSYNNPYYFVFEHHIKYAMPYLPEENGIEILNKDGSADYVDYSYVGATDGYVIADANYGHFYRIWLENLYTTDPLIRNDKDILMDIGYTYYSEADGGSSGRDNAGNVWSWTNNPVSLDVHYVDDPEDENYGRAYIEIMIDSPEGFGAQDMYTTLDTYLPNIVSFRFTAITDRKPIINPGEANTNDYFYTANNLTRGSFDGRSKMTIDRYYENSDRSESLDYLTIQKQYTPADLELVFDDMTNVLQTEENMQRIEVDGRYYGTNLVSDVSKGTYTGLAANPYIYTREDSLLWNNDNTTGQFFEYGMVTTNLDTTYEIKLRYNDAEKIVTIRTYDVNATLRLFTEAINASISSGNTVDETRQDYSSYQDIYQYEVTCLYEAMYDLINDSTGTQTSTGRYHGGRIDIDIRTVAPAGSTALNWVTSDWASEARTDGIYTFYFYARLETVQTNFSQSECNWDVDYEAGISSFYCYNGYYYHYQSYIPLHYQSISRNVQYYIYLTRDGNATYSIDNQVVKDACTISPNNTNQQNIKNLTDILKIDLITPEENASGIQNGSIRENYNQWLLPVNESDTWHINIIAAVDDSMEYVGRGFNSKSAGMDYTVNLRIKMDIEALSITLEPLVNESTNTMATLRLTDFTNNSQNMWYNYQTSTDKAGQPYNLAPTFANFKLYYPYQNRWLQFNNFAIEQNTATRYQDLLYDFIYQELVLDPEMRGSDGFRIQVEFGYYVNGDFNNQHIHNSVYSVDLYLNYYRQLPFDTSRISFYQDNMTIKMSADYSVNNQFERLQVTINQYNRNSNNRFTQTQISIGKSGASQIHYTATGYFSYNSADCFSSSEYGSTYNYVYNHYTAYPGSVQGGNNQFTVTPIHDGYEVEHNLLEKGLKYESPDVWFYSPINPTVDFDYSSSVNRDPSGDTEPIWMWDHSSSTNGYVEQRYEAQGSWGVINRVYTDFSYMRGGSMRASWSYGFDLGGAKIMTGSPTFNEAAAVYNSLAALPDRSGNTTNYSSISTIRMGQSANWFRISVTTYCKPGFEAVFRSGGIWRFSYSISPGIDVQRFIPRAYDYINRRSVLSDTEMEWTGGYVRKRANYESAGGAEGGGDAASAASLLLFNPRGTSFSTLLTADTPSPPSTDPPETEEPPEPSSYTYFYNARASISYTGEAPVTFSVNFSISIRQGGKSGSTSARMATNSHSISCFWSDTIGSDVDVSGEATGSVSITGFNRRLGGFAGD